MIDALMIIAQLFRRMYKSQFNNLFSLYTTFDILKLYLHQFADLIIKTLSQIDRILYSSTSMLINYCKNKVIIETIKNNPIPLFSGRFIHNIQFFFLLEAHLQIHL
ncbi:hypothetical protein D3C87_882650 [compost metagenome]|jgi:hypothetical protein